jgi:anti-sigma B factor antagonist
MEISAKKFKHCDIVSIKGRIDSSTAPKFSGILEEITNAGRFKIVIDLSEVDFMSSAGFRALLASQRVCKRYNRGEIVLAAVSTRVTEALELAGFNELFKLYSDPVEAVGSI